MIRHPFDYGDDEVARATVDRLLQHLDPIDAEIIRLRYIEDWKFPEIAQYIGQQYFGRTSDNPLWDRSVRYRVEQAFKKLKELM